MQKESGVQKKAAGERVRREERKEDGDQRRKGGYALFIKAQ